MNVEYRVVEVKRFVVTRYAMPEGCPGTVGEKGEYGNAEIAHEVAYALCKAEHEQLGYPIDDTRIQYPKREVPDSFEQKD